MEATTDNIRQFLQQQALVEFDEATLLGLTEDLDKYLSEFAELALYTFYFGMHDSGYSEKEIEGMVERIKYLAFTTAKNAIEKAKEGGRV